MKEYARAAGSCGSPDESPAGSSGDEPGFEDASDAGEPSTVGGDPVKDHLMRFLAASPPPADWTERKRRNVEEWAELILEEDDVLRESIETNLQLYEQIRQQYPDQNVDEWWWTSVWWWPWR